MTAGAVSGEHIAAYIFCRAVDLEGLDLVALTGELDGERGASVLEVRQLIRSLHPSGNGRVEGDAVFVVVHAEQHAIVARQRTCDRPELLIGFDALAGAVVDDLLIGQRDRRAADIGVEDLFGDSLVIVIRRADHQHGIPARPDTEVVIDLIGVFQLALLLRIDRVRAVGYQRRVLRDICLS